MPAILRTQSCKRGHQHLDLRVVGRLFIEREPGGGRGRGPYDMLGNLKVYLGPVAIDHYGDWLREIAYPALPRTVFLWLLRVGLIGAFAIHMHAAWALTRMNHRARPTKYASGRDYIAANFASRTMRWTGIIVILFVVWHLADLTWDVGAATRSDSASSTG